MAVVARSDRASMETTASEVERLGRRALPLIADVSSDVGADRVVQETMEAFGRIDLLVNNAGATPKHQTLLETTVDDWDTAIAVDLKGAFLCCTRVAREMRARGTGNIINVAGAAAHRCMPGFGAFGPVKAAVISLTQQMAVEWAAYGIRVNAVSPGPIATHPTAMRMQSQEIRERVARIPMERVGTAEEVAQAVVFLASGESSFITGQSLVVDGGSVLTSYLT